MSNDKCQDQVDGAKPFSTIPGPWPSLPFFGTEWHNFIGSFLGRYDLSHLHEVYMEKYRQYGPIFKEESLWNHSIVHVFDPADYETICLSQGNIPLRPPNEFVSHYRLSNPDRYPNVGLTNMNGEEWLLHRNLLAPAIMKLRTINENMLSQNEICDNFLDYLRDIQNPDTGVVENIQEATYKLALESICMLCLDSRMNSFADDQTGNDSKIMIESTKLLFDTFNKLYYGLPLWKYYKNSPYRDLERAESSIYDIASKYVKKAIEDISTGNPGSTVLQTLLDTKDLSIKDVKITIIDFIMGGIFTVSNTFSYLFYHLAANQTVQEKLYQEIISVKEEVDSLNTTDPDFTGSTFLINHIAKMPYLKACVRECFRLNCPVPGIMRITNKPIVLSGYEIPAQTVVFSHLNATCLLEEYFRKPNEFRPERWIDPIEKATIHPYALLPFGFGKRICPGKRFTESEIYLSLAKLVKEFKLELANESDKLELKQAFIMVPAKPISIRLISR